MKLDKCINLNISGVILRGAGSDAGASVLIATGDTPHHRNLLVAGGGTIGN